jgi:hypothetical protein
MAGTATHIAIADKINSILGDGVIKNLPLFFGGNLAPDAIHAKQNYQRADKKHSHLCDGIRSYGYGYPELAKLFKDRVNEFIRNYYQTASEDKDLYFGYIVHLLADEFYLLSAFERLENHLKNKGVNTDEPGFRKNLADEVSDDPSTYNEKYIEFFSETYNIICISAQDYDFKQNAVDVLEAVWDYEVKDYIGVNEINISKRWVINNFFKKEQAKNNDDREQALKLLDFAANDIIENLSCKDGIVKMLA